MNEEENTPKEYDGKKYTAYEAQQRQRKLETSMRADRQQIELLTQGGANDDTITGAKVKYFQRQDEYVKFSKAMNLPQQWERVTIDGKNALGSKFPKKAESVNKITTENVAKLVDSGIIKEESKKPIMPITDRAIERVPKVDIDGYTEEQCIEIQKQHKELLKFSKEHNENREVAFVFRESLTDKIPLFGDDDYLDFGTSLSGKGDNLTILHNHPRNSSFSDVDISLFKNLKSLKTLTIVKNNGDVEFITKGDNFNDELFKLEYNRLKKKIIKNNTDAEYDKFINKLLSKTKAGVIWSEKNVS